MPQFRIILNPTAGKGTAAKSLAQLNATLDKYKLDYDLVQTEYPWHAAELAEKAAGEGIETVVSAGGDGTFNEVLNGLMMAKKNKIGYPSLGIICIGRGNDFAFSMGIPTTLEAGCMALSREFKRRIDVGRVTSELYPEGRYFGNGIGIGFDAMVGFIAAELPLKGAAGYLAGVLKTMMIYSPAPVMEIVADDEVFAQPTLMASVMNGRRMGGAFMMAPTSRPDDGFFDLCIASEMTKLKILQMVPRFIGGTQAGDSHIRNLHAHKVIVRALKGTLPAHADGETLCTHGKEITAECLHQQIDLIYLPAEEKK
jgi:YegS/Rv2252/BmrU family lipid kinase